MPFVRNERSGYFVQQNRGKLSLCLDPRIEAGKTIIRELIAKVDVLVENYAPGVIGVRVAIGRKTGVSQGRLAGAC
jgi:crotonobetainyl-CoA:carnitine CoA-transferase CaiB-like acyl-CoA transferase